MSLPQNIADDLATLDADAIVSAAATATRQAATVAKQAAIDAEAAASADENKALTAQNTQLAKVIADLNAAYAPSQVATS